MKINKYPDGTSYVSIPENWIGSFREITFRINNYEDLIHLIQLCDVLRYNNVHALIKIPCMLDAQADKRFNTFHSSGLKIVTELLQATTEQSEIYFEVFHPHNSEVLEALIPNVEIIDNSKFIIRVLFEQYGRTVNNKNIDNLILMSSDAGGFKPLMKLCDKLNWKGEVASASKSREYKDGKTILTQMIAHSDFKGKDILIIDDICVYGGTFKGLAKMLRERNCGKLYLAVSHMTIQNLGEDPVTNYFDKVFTTDSKFDYYASLIDGNIGNQPNNLKVIKLF